MFLGDQLQTSSSSSTRAARDRAQGRPLGLGTPPAADAQGRRRPQPHEPVRLHRQPVRVPRGRFEPVRRAGEHGPQHDRGRRRRRAHRAARPRPRHRRDARRRGPGDVRDVYAAHRRIVFHGHGYAGAGPLVPTLTEELDEVLEALVESVRALEAVNASGGDDGAARALRVRDEILPAMSAPSAPPQTTSSTSSPTSCGRSRATRRCSTSGRRATRHPIGPNALELGPQAVTTHRRESPAPLSPAGADPPPSPGAPTPAARTPRIPGEECAAAPCRARTHTTRSQPPTHHT